MIAAGGRRIALSVDPDAQPLELSDGQLAVRFLALVDQAPAGQSLRCTLTIRWPPPDGGARPAKAPAVSLDVQGGERASDRADVAQRLRQLVTEALEKKGLQVPLDAALDGQPRRLIALRLGLEGGYLTIAGTLEKGG